MVEKNVILIIFTIFLISLCTKVCTQCVQASPCSCTLPDGTGYDFSILGKQSPLNLTSFGTTQNITYWFQPCKDVIFTSNNVTDGCNKPVSLCTWNSTEKGPQSRGNVSEATLQLQSSNEHILMLVYKHKNYTTKIHLICCGEGCVTNLQFDNGIPTASLSTTLLLYSPAVCKHRREGISGGSVFFILLLVFLGVYFIGGALALKFLRGATGWEMLPNHKFWLALGTKIRIGFSFLCSGCQDSYERI
ncbi:uncharacterized protein LOC117176167 [Belonocnema kinseyi]|uniref:uncharacterized protein LOC117176167 n=1 Tax=Belonocnema kinseyi TaxID=2817044 RepID=UPI00143D9528|nr:uncharacterized protein LOC117176167 [Belonocnema kinseyi]